MSAKTKQVDADKALAKARERGLTDALAQERLALAAIAKVVLLEVDDPQRVLARLDAMCRAAGSNRKVPPGTRRAMLDGTRLIRRAIERERGLNQGTQATLLDPPRPEPNPRLVDEIAAATDGPQQLGLVGNEQIGGDAEQAHEERVATLGAIHAAIVHVLQRHGASSDEELHHRYAMSVVRGHFEVPPPIQTLTSIKERRRELVAAGRIVAVEGSRFDLLERTA